MRYFRLFFGLRAPRNSPGAYLAESMGSLGLDPNASILADLENFFGMLPL